MAHKFNLRLVKQQERRVLFFFIMMEQTIEVLKQTELCGQQFQVYGSADEPLFKAKDVAEILEHSNHKMMLEGVDDDEKGVRIVYSHGGPQETWMLTEYGLYEVLMQSRKPIAKQFKKGVKQVLCQLRLKAMSLLPQGEQLLGVTPIIYQGKVWYHLRSIYQGMGLKRHSADGKCLSNRYPGEVVRLNGSNYISYKVAQMLVALSQYRLLKQQLLLLPENNNPENA